MRRKTVLFGGLITGWLALAGPAFAQIAPAPPDPLAGMRAAAAANAQLCTNSETSACAQANPKILAAAMGSPVLAQSLQGLTATDDRESALPRAVAAFRGAGVDLVSAEGGYTDPAAARAEINVIAEIRGREKPDEFVVLAATLDDDCNAALLLEAARDIHLTGLRPRRSIRFVLFGDKSVAPWAYVRRHRGELDHAIAAVIFENGCARVTGFTLPGREDLEPGIREALDFAPIKEWGVAEDKYGAPMPGDMLDFLLEGVPSLTANRHSSASAPAATSTSAGVDLDTLKKNSAIAGVLAFGLAEHAAPLGPRLSRAEVEALLKRTGIDGEMRTKDAWGAWESGQRGRQP
jgi:hypothetical protein